MPFDDLLLFANAAIDEIKSDSFTQENLAKLNAVFPPTLIIAALDIIDRGNVIPYETPWGHKEYEILGSTARYSVLLDIKSAPLPYSCTCPAFIYSVLMAETHIMCKHILATLISRRLKRSPTRPASANDLAALYTRQFPLPENRAARG
ncbi:hypothetical protein CVT26_015263 [Gymnopilus dilepis]|uniref:SWIM-type domain-containing protein n=1 Tax=Gymnopilus dilepis TaxID=231916 RepID=A0A409W9Y5_9AGAR|nr:hypothetical protein CVT26_015263 [Gymnopilus dilepis]